MLIYWRLISAYGRYIYFISSCNEFVISTINIHKPSWWNCIYLSTNWTRFRRGLHIVDISIDVYSWMCFQRIYPWIIGPNGRVYGGSIIKTWASGLYLKNKKNRQNSWRHITPVISFMVISFVLTLIFCKILWYLIQDLRFHRTGNVRDSCGEYLK